MKTPTILSFETCTKCVVGCDSIMSSSRLPLLCTGTPQQLSLTSKLSGSVCYLAPGESQHTGHCILQWRLNPCNRNVEDSGLNLWSPAFSRIRTQCQFFQHREPRWPSQAEQQARNDANTGVLIMDDRWDARFGREQLAYCRKVWATLCRHEAAASSENWGIGWGRLLPLVGSSQTPRSKVKSIGFTQHCGRCCHERATYY
jgi:hypothetical protein